MLNSLHQFSPLAFFLPTGKGGNSSTTGKCSVPITVGVHGAADSPSQSLSGFYPSQGSLKKMSGKTGKNFKKLGVAIHFCLSFSSQESCCFLVRRTELPNPALCVWAGGRRQPAKHCGS